MSIRLRITAWFAAALILVVAITYVVILSISNGVLQKRLQENLVEVVEHNYDEVEFYDIIVRDDNDLDHYINYNDGYLEIDDDYLDILNGISTALYSGDGVLLYGENPIAQKTTKLAFSDGNVQRIKGDSEDYYVYDRMLTQYGTEGLYLRGVVSEEQGHTQISSIAQFSLILLPLVLVIAILGGYMIADRALEPIGKIAEAARHISRGKDLKKRIELGDGKDELHELADSFNEMFDRLDDSFEAERQFTSDVSHELRTPMTVIMAQCELSLDTSQEKNSDADMQVQEYKQALTVIRRQGKKMSKLISEMLEFTRLERKASSYAMTDIDFSGLAISLCEDMSLIGENGISLDYSGIETDVQVKGNYELLTRLLANLITNAYKYGKENGHISVSLKKESEHIVLAVSDDGIGIMQDSIDKIFNRFYQVDSSRFGNGTGLGLSMVREIANLHGGEVKVESEFGVGSVFTVRI